MKTLFFSTDNNVNYQIGTLFTMTYNKRTDNFSIVRLATQATINDPSNVAESIDNIATLANLLNECKKERAIANNIVNGFNEVSGDGIYGYLPSEARSTFFNALKNATNNTIFAVVGVTESEDTKGVYRVEYMPLFASEINLIKTNLGMSKRFYESCKGFKHIKQWKKAANVALLQGAIKSYVSAIRSGAGNEFLAPYLNTLENIEIASETSEAKAV